MFRFDNIKCLKNWIWILFERLHMLDKLIMDLFQDEWEKLHDISLF